jgi:uncharacterized repeat protein (TIGR03803 family)
MKYIQFATIAVAVGIFISIPAPLHAQFVLSDIYDFNCETGGCDPYDFGQLTLGTNGNLYGTTIGGGTGHGSIFMVAPDGTGYQEWDFDGPSLGDGPAAGLTLAEDGNFYGTTTSGGSFGYGTLFRFNPVTTTITVLHHFTGMADGGSPNVAPVEPKISDGYLYGFAAGQFVPYRVNMAKGTFKSYAGQNFTSTAPLVAASDGYFYGTNNNGGANADGAIFRMTLKGAITTRYSFTGGTDGEYPQGPLVLAGDGLLYGTTSAGGQNGNGALFNLAPSSKKVKPLYSFTALNGSGVNNDGATPLAGLVAAGDGNLYGTTSLGGTNAVGTAFRIATGGGSFASLASFTGNPGFFGTEATATLMENTDGSFYAVTKNMGENSAGYLYKLAYNFLNITWCCNRWLVLDQPVTVLGQNLEGAVSVTIGGAAAQFQPGSSTYLTAEVPSGAIDGPIMVTLATGLQVSSETAHIAPKIINLDPSSGPVGTQVAIVGGGFTGATKVTFGGVKATTFTVVTPALIQAIVPTGAKSGKVDVVTPDGTAASKQTFTVN